MQARAAGKKTGLSIALMAFGNYTCQSGKASVRQEEGAITSKLAKEVPPCSRSVVFFRTTGGVANFVHEKSDLRNWASSAVQAKTKAQAIEVSLDDLPGSQAFPPCPVCSDADKMVNCRPKQRKWLVKLAGQSESCASHALRIRQRREELLRRWSYLTLT